ncbi:ATP-dependent zinc metalloprotease FtsH [Sphingopyxis indica]|uniref:ATP-dependent zinc metalloprotease FtsH n=1 Tax=Sphingopyxis indica TaxID=436663 RepID=UPI002938E4D6|nr:ATP-dependent zinc metalloprotease FtsH [Sphingopyxis indica]WOF44970.1 ATP-dependent zinc metalloprotease FtsH [Sphingopyxis indica]
MNKGDGRRKGLSRFDITYFVAMMFAVLIIQDLWAGQGHIKTIPFSEYQSLVARSAVTDLVVGPTRITGSYKPPVKKGEPEHFSTVRVDPATAAELQQRGIKFEGEPPPGFLAQILSWLLPIVGFGLMWMFLLRPMQGGAAGGLMGIGRSRAKVYSETNVKVTFSDVAGVDEAKQELTEIIGFLRDPGTYGRLGARIPKGVLLVGPPGTGKTLLARAVAGEAGVPFFSITGSEFVEMFVGVGAARVRDLFEQARKQAPAILFIDELDALGRARGIDMPGGGHDEKEQTLNQLLAEMDGFDPSAGIVVLAATNRPEVLDPALLRAGRFDRQVLVDRPDKKGRIDVLQVHLKKIQAAPDLDLDAVAAMTPGFTGADLANLVNEAALVATRRGAQAASLDDFTQAFERIVAGIEKKSRVLSSHERAIVAHHEIGHALVAMSLPGTDPVQKVSIIPRGIAALGYTLQRPTEDRFLISRSELQSRMAALLGGRAAEDLIFGDVSTGAADDLQRATDIARDMVVRFGMTAELGQVAYEPETGSFLVGQTPAWRPKNYGDGTAEAIDEAVRKLIDQAFQAARAVLERNRDLLETSAKELLAKETLVADDLRLLATRLRPTNALAAYGATGASLETTQAA